MKTPLATIGCVGSLLLSSASLATAGPLSFQVVVNTAPLVGNANGPFSLDFQLNDGSATLAGVNTVTIDNFSFGGGSAIGAANLFGDATGDLFTSVSLTDSNDIFNEFFQTFTPGNGPLSFNVTMSTNVDPGPTPDLFSFAILDGVLANIATTGLGNSLLLVNISNTTLGLPDVQTFNSTDPAGVTVDAVPEPASYLLFGTGLVGVGLHRWRRGKSAA